MARRCVDEKSALQGNVPANPQQLSERQFLNPIHRSKTSSALCSLLFLALTGCWLPGPHGGPPGLPGMPGHTQLIQPCEMPVVATAKEEVGPIASFQITKTEVLAQAVTTKVETYE
jgi:hypothetical protein